VKQTATKALARSYFYREFLPSRLTPDQLANGQFLVLLGDTDLELTLLRELGVPGGNIHSVENDRKLYLKQLRFNRDRDEPVRFYNKSLENLIAEQLHSNKQLLVLNLDIYGAYLSAIDPVMTQILRFARRNTQTIIATYTNVGRDRQQLLEGLKSLSVCLWLAPDATMFTVNRMYSRYVSAGMSSNVAFHMVLRHLFWVRSHMEHVILSAITVGQVSGDLAAEFLGRLENCWQQATIPFMGSMTYGALVRTVLSLDRPGRLPKIFNLVIQEVDLVTYAARGGYYHHGWYTVYGKLKRSVSADVWLTDALLKLTAKPLLFANHGADRLMSFDTMNGTQLEYLTIWSGDEFGTAGRSLLIPETSPMLQAADKEVADQAWRREDRPQVGDLVIDVKEMVRQLAAEGLMTDEVMERLPQGCKLERRSVTAIIARANGARNRAAQRGQTRRQG
jgi:hypothetical protein